MYNLFRDLSTCISCLLILGVVPLKHSCQRYGGSIADGTMMVVAEDENGWAEVVDLGLCSELKCLAACPHQELVAFEEWASLAETSWNRNLMMINHGHKGGQTWILSSLKSPQLCTAIIISHYFLIRHRISEPPGKHTPATEPLLQPNDHSQQHSQAGNDDIPSRGVEICPRVRVHNHRDSAPSLELWKMLKRTCGNRKPSRMNPACPEVDQVTHIQRAARIDLLRTSVRFRNFSSKTANFITLNIVIIFSQFITSKDWNCIAPGPGILFFRILDRDIKSHITRIPIWEFLFIFRNGLGASELHHLEVSRILGCLVCPNFSNTSVGTSDCPDSRGCSSLKAYSPQHAPTQNYHDSPELQSKSFFDSTSVKANILISSKYLESFLRLCRLPLTKPLEMLEFFSAKESLRTASTYAGLPSLEYQEAEPTIQSFPELSEK
nr:hypothetical protein Iba_scaffold150CG0530 [Ipomoea batatas]